MKHQALFSKLLSFLILVSILSSCKNWNNTQKGAVIGAGTGAAVGAVIGNKSGQAARGAGIGAVVGGVAGTAIGVYMDKQAKKMEEQIKDAEIERVDEGIKVTFASGILFGFDSHSLTPASQENLQKFAEILREYPDTDIMIEGHTDNKGSRSYNQGLSERRAQSVRNYLKMKNVSDARMQTVGYSFDRPVATNDTEEGRAKNRRVEILITANEDLINKAEKGELKN
ncbi:OmpA family protein [Cecembia rubra]|uniref:Outer membrane protein OmpA-like peptidoglycan-associated protein n=1 Tax=Cecembia rubra TaxID=1485585 RepID=A0A2P8DW17_9BACT|nr:OmpA family protein [Cecembia rubra]PSL01420.1 outer membrane protein OmpA-like peptidoglycan-associated protein [Cecembia rubra]